MSASGRRLSYCIGHNPNTTRDVLFALRLGANAIEPDLNIREESGRLVIAHGPKLRGPGYDSDPDLIQFLQDLRTMAVDYPQLALVVFDMKPPCHIPENTLKLLTAIRENLTFDLPINVLISASSLDSVSMFANIHSTLKGRKVF
jgi:hypothetical protein